MTKSSRTLTAATMACLLSLDPLAHSTIVPIAPMESVGLSTRDKSAIALLACNRPLAGSDMLVAERVLGSQKIHVDVVCQARGLVENLPSFRVAWCNNMSGRWNCTGADAVNLTLAGREIELTYAPAVGAKAALEIVNFAASVPSFNSREVAANIGGRCRVTDGKSAPFEGAINFYFSCNAWSGAITRHCGGERCRMFFTEWGEFIP